MVEGYAGEPDCKGKSDADMCIFVDAIYPFGTLVMVDPVFKRIILPPAVVGNVLYVAGWATPNGTGFTQTFWTRANGIWVRADGAVTKGSKVFLKNDGSGTVTADDAQTIQYSDFVGIALEDSADRYTLSNRQGLENCVKIDFNGCIAIGAVPAAPIAP